MKKLVAGNWKMYKSISEAQNWIETFQSQYQPVPEVEVLVIPSATALYSLQFNSHIEGLRFGAQNLYPAKEGAFTGELSGPMLKDAGAHYVLVGHSERRFYARETPDFLAQKVKAALDAGLIPIYCVGESLQDREQRRHLDMVTQQLKEGLATLNKTEKQRVIIAYEPVWAIGTGRTATIANAEEMHLHIQACMPSNDAHSERTLILYGGSVKPENADELFASPHIDGVLVGGASLDPVVFSAIVKAAQRLF